MSEQYGLEVRPWPEEPCGHEPPYCGVGYFSDYRAMFATHAFTVPVERGNDLYGFIEQDESGPWFWHVGYFSWTPDGNLYETRVSGTNATRRIAEREARQAAASVVRQDEQWFRDYDTRERARRVGP